MRGDAERQRYLEERLQLRPKEFWDEVDAWPLYAGGKNIARFMYLLDIFQETLKVAGDIAEFGIWRGATTSLMAKFLAIYEPGGRKRVHAFDNFEGFDDETVESKVLRSDYKGRRDELEQFLALDRLQEFVVIHEGKIEETVPRLTSPTLAFSLVIMDCDVYLPTITAANFVHARLQKGGIILFDQWGDDHWPGETQAATEFFARHGQDYILEAPGIVAQPSLIARRIRGPGGEEEE